MSLSSSGDGGHTALMPPVLPLLLASAAPPFNSGPLGAFLSLEGFSGTVEVLLGGIAALLEGSCELLGALAPPEAFLFTCCFSK